MKTIGLKYENTDAPGINTQRRVKICHVISLIHTINITHWGVIQCPSMIQKKCYQLFLQK